MITFALLGLVTAAHGNQWVQQVCLSMPGLELFARPQPVLWFIETTDHALVLRSDEQSCVLKAEWVNSKKLRILGVEDCAVLAGGGSLHSFIVVGGAYGNLTVSGPHAEGSFVADIDVGRSRLGKDVPVGKHAQISVQVGGKCAGAAPPIPRERSHVKIGGCGEMVVDRNPACPFGAPKDGFLVDACPDEGGFTCPVPPRSSQRRDARYLGENALFRELLTRGATHCKAIFKQGPLADALAKVALEDAGVIEENLSLAPGAVESFTDNKTVLGLASVLARTGHVKLCERHGKRTYGIYSTESRDILLFNSACNASGVDELNVDVGTEAMKALLILGHEIGHAIDIDSGGLSNCEKGAELLAQGEAENRANAYGVQIAACYATLFADLAQTGLYSRPVEFDSAKNRQEEDEKSRTCLHDFYLGVAQTLQSKGATIEPSSFEFLLKEP